MDVDLLSLVECDHYDDHFKPQLQALGYDSIWKKRPRGSSQDGCCIAWRRCSFELLAQTHVEYIDKFDPVTQRTSKDRIALLALLRVKLTGDRILFVSTHLARNPEQAEMDKLRSRQINQVVRAMASFAKENNAKDAPVVLTGDLNATSFDRLRGIVSAVALLCEETFVHPFTFDCRDVGSGTTSVTTARQMRIDATLYQTGCLELVDACRVPSLSSANPIPNPEHPSDHVPITATFRIRTPLEMTQQLAREWYLQLAGRGRCTSLPLNREQLREVFKVYDYDAEERVTLRNLRRTIATVMGSGTGGTSEVQMVLDKLPPDGLDFNAFIAAYTDAITAVGMPGRDDFLDAFSVFDNKNTGVIDLEELALVFKECSCADMPEDKLKELFKQMDTKGNNQIEQDEFLNHLSKVWITKFMEQVNGA
eukprot:gnl/TRDRNA2_/TRDRNA2_165972_c2_seq1.p1 gnl/TRDRNA2_/TRDRNA2_165972_c2~~gnl/TRDRNA2_/TRDRNA2_165972_c2_seq1.p1  ORF type:complete len:440 (+),score=80.97 gnl/TRDRNA2_/TRDRNA2_165972_c2_seq1:52-1320(+)